MHTIHFSDGPTVGVSITPDMLGPRLVWSGPWYWHLFLCNFRLSGNGPWIMTEMENTMTFTTMVDSAEHYQILRSFIVDLQAPEECYFFLSFLLFFYIKTLEYFPIVRRRSALVIDAWVSIKWQCQWQGLGKRNKYWVHNMLHRVVSSWFQRQAPSFFIGCSQVIL